ncbi:hypothetical protein TNCV_2701161 [Trichonephila clavipes]|nr:hypothetical protein TNCV_2701161 [Trichonephila clavipes]
MLDDAMPEAVKEKDNSTASDKFLCKVAYGNALINNRKTTRKILAVKKSKKKHRAQSSSKSEESRRLSVMEEDDEEYANSTDTPVSPLPYKSPSDSLTSDTPNGTHV